MTSTGAQERMGNAGAAGKAILLAGFVAGLIDFLFASVQTKLRGGSPLDPWKGVAGGLLGPEAQEGGLGMAVLGAGLHFFICLGAAALLYLILRRQPWLLGRPLVTGVLFGIGFLLVMNYVILPLSRIGRPIYPVEDIFVHAFWHIVLVGIPTAWVLSHRMRAG